MKKYLQKIQDYFKRKGYQESPVADEIFAISDTDNSSGEADSDTNISIGKLPTDVITALKKAQKEVQEFEQTLKSIKQNTIV